jgi:hypothetical protein
LAASRRRAAPKKAQRTKVGEHVIEVRDAIGKPELRIDDVLMRYGTLSDGQFFLHDYAYDRSDDLTTLAQKYLRYREKQTKVAGVSRARNRRDDRM